MKTSYSQAARRQLASLYDYIAARSGSARARAYIGRITRYCESLTTFPHRGTGRDELLPGLRTIGFERRVTVCFVVQPDGLLILQVLYAGRDINAAFETE